MPINAASKEGGRGNMREGRDAGRENNEAKSAGRINRHDDWSDSDWVVEEGVHESGKPELIEFIVSSTDLNSSAALVSLQTANPSKVSSHSIIPYHSLLPSLKPYFPFFPPSSVPFPLLTLHCLDLGRLELPPLLSLSQLWITWRPGTQRLPGPPDDSQPGHNKWLTALFT